LGFTGALAVGVTPVVAAKNEVRVFDNEFTWGSGILGHAENDFKRPVIFNPTVVKPDAPSNLMDPLGTATGLTWTDPTPSQAAATLANTKNEIGFKIVKAPAPGGVLGVFDLANPVATLPANATKWTEAPAALPNVAYAVVAYNVAGDSLVSNPVINAAPAAPTCAPATTAFIVPGVSTADVSVTLNCFDNANNEQTFTVSRSGGAGPVVNTVLPLITATAPSALTFPDSPVVEATTYTYSVTATNVFGTSAPAAVVTVTTGVSVPLAPTGLAAVPVLAPCPPGIQSPCKPADVKLSWTDKAFNETGYTVTRIGGVGAAFAPVNLPGTALDNTGTTLSYVDTTAAENVPYTYTVTAINGSGASPTPYAYTLPVTAPTIPTGLSVVPDSGLDVNGTYVDQAKLTWTDNAFNETGYTVSRAVIAPAALVAPATVVGNVTANSSNNPMGIATAGWAAPNPPMSFTDTNLADGVTYAYTVAAVNGVASTSSAPAVNALMPGIIIAAPTNFVATPNRSGLSIGLSWRDNATNETDYLVEQRESTDGGLTYSPWKNVAGTPIASAAVPNSRGGTVTVPRQMIATDLGKLYAFRVSARNVPSDSPYAYVQSNLQAPTLPAAPVISGSFVQATRMVTVTWPAVAPLAGTTVSYIVNVNGVPVPTTQTTYTFRATVAQLTAATPVVVTVQTVARANRVAGQTVFGSSTSTESAPYSPIVAGPAAPATPTGFAATVSAVGAVTLNWTAIAPIAATTITYMVSVDGGTPVPMTRGAAITPALTPGVSHTVTVVARATSLGLFTDSVTPATTTVDLTAAATPNAPATATLNGAGTTLTWTAPAALAGTGSTNATYTYTVQVTKDAGTTWTTLTATPLTVRTLAVTTPVGANYQFRVAAQATRYGQPPSVLGAWVTTTPPLNRAPAQSTALTNALDAITPRTFNVGFTNTSTNISGWIIQRGVSATAAGAVTWTPITVTPTATGTGYTFSNTVAAAGFYRFRIQASSLASSTAVVTTPIVQTP
jgi:hypothetical protein